MVLFGVSERPLTALDSSAPRLLRMAPLRHSLRAAPRLDARDSDDAASTLSAPGYGEADSGSGEFVMTSCVKRVSVGPVHTSLPFSLPVHHGTLDSLSNLFVRPSST
jgi:hypothetical protein